MYNILKRPGLTENPNALVVNTEDDDLNELAKNEEYPKNNKELLSIIGRLIKTRVGYKFYTLRNQFVEALADNQNQNKDKARNAYEKAVELSNQILSIPELQDHYDLGEELNKGLDQFESDEALRIVAHFPSISTLKPYLEGTLEKIMELSKHVPLVKNKAEKQSAYLKLAFLEMEVARLGTDHPDLKFQPGSWYNKMPGLYQEPVGGAYKNHNKYMFTQVIEHIKLAGLLTDQGGLNESLFESEDDRQKFVGYFAELVAGCEWRSFLSTRQELEALEIGEKIVKITTGKNIETTSHTELYRSVDRSLTLHDQTYPPFKEKNQNTNE